MAVGSAIHPDHPDFARMAAAGAVVAYFGYGSLVNRDTLRTKFLAIRRARVSGWRRFWQPRPDHDGVALLSVREEAAAELDGVVVYDLGENLPAVDEREAGYERRAVPPAAITVENAPETALLVFLYEAIRPNETAADTGSAILQSYLDAVMQGFLAVHGEAGLRRFVTNTAGFETRIVCDREAPRYPRSVRLREGEAALFDLLLRERGATLDEPIR